MINVRRSVARSGNHEVSTLHITNTESGIENIRLQFNLKSGQTWSKEKPRVVQAVMNLTGVDDPELIVIDGIPATEFAA